MTDWAAWFRYKTFQHAYEHGDTLLRMGLWWQHIAEQIAARQSLAQETKVD